MTKQLGYYPLADCAQEDRNLFAASKHLQDYSFSIPLVALVFLQQHRHVLTNPLLQLTSLSIKYLKLLIQFLQLHLEIEVVNRSFGYTDISSRVDTPTLCLYLLKCPYFAKAWNIGIYA